MNAKFLVGPIAIAACVLSAPALADGEPIVVTKVVNARDLDVNTSEGALKLYDRLTSAARHVCGTDPRVGLAPPIYPRACYEDALANAVRSANRAQLTRVYLTTHTLEVAQTYGIDIPVLVAGK
jgi:UrcA family protein